jgi:hypothetical protein
LGGIVDIRDIAEHITVWTHLLVAVIACLGIPAIVGTLVFKLLADATTFQVAAGSGGLVAVLTGVMGRTSTTAMNVSRQLERRKNFRLYLSLLVTASRLE